MKFNKNFFKKDKQFIYQKNFNNFTILLRKYDSPEMRALLANPDYYLNNSSGPFFKSEEGDTTTIGVVNVANQKIVIKRYNIKSFWHRIRKCCCRSRALHSWLSIYRIQQLGISTLAPIAVIENRCGPLRGTAYLLTEYVAEGVRGCDYFAKEMKYKPEWQNVISNIAAMAAILQKAYLRHHDFQYGNILVVGDQPLLLDLDHTKQYSANSVFFRRAFHKDICHFLDFVKSNQTAYTMFKDEFKKFHLMPTNAKLTL